MEHAPWIKSVRISDLPEFYQLVAHQVAAYLPEEEAVRLTLDICQTVQGQPYIAKPEDALKQLMYRYIRENHNGLNYGSLARDCGLTERRVRQIINGDERQTNIFEVLATWK